MWRQQEINESKHLQAHIGRKVLIYDHENSMIESCLYLYVDAVMCKREIDNLYPP